MGRKGGFGAKRFHFLGGNSIGAEAEEIGPCSIANEEAGTGREKGVSGAGRGT